MAKRPLPTPEELRQLLRYEPETGRLYWLERDISFFDHCTPEHQRRVCNAWNGSWAGKEASTLDRYGYKVVTIFHHHIAAHRVAWCAYYGHWPEDQIDHINGSREDNRISNLRDIPKAENQRNMRLARHNSSGVSGVYFCQTTKRWRAEVRSHGKRHRLGRFASKEEAAAAVKNKRRELGFPERHGEADRAYGFFSKGSFKAV